MIVKGYIFTYLYLALVLFISFILNKYFNVREIITRKIIHISISFCYVIFYKYFGSTIHVIVPPITFIILNYISYKKDLFKGMEGSVKSLGTVYYPISVFIMGLATYFDPSFYPYFGIGLFAMAFGDGFAPLIAGYLRSMKIYDNKTLVGSLTVFVITFVLCILFGYSFNLNFKIIDILLVSFSSVTLEMIGKRGLDNLYLPLGVSLVGYLLGVI